jgi:hypothetical protein
MFQINFDENKLTAIVRQAVTEAFGELPKNDSISHLERKTLHSIRELSVFLGCSIVTAQKFKNEGRIPYRQIGRKVMFDTQDVLKALESSKKKKG